MQVPVRDVLKKYFPEAAAEPLERILKENRILLIITRDRITKLGDFKAQTKTKPHRISVNGNLNPYAALLVFLHEFAHFTLFELAGGKVHPPHGKAWKHRFGELIRQAISMGMFPEALKEPLYDYSFHVRASGLADTQLTKILRSYDRPGRTQDWIFLDELHDQPIFQTKNGRVFKIEEKVRTRYRCTCIQSKRKYLVSGMSLVKPLSKQLNMFANAKR